MAVVERVRAETGLDVETMWTDDGFVVRFPETDEPPDPRLMMPASDEVEALVLQPARRNGDVRRQVPRGRGARAAPAQAPAGRPQPAVAAAQARGRSPRRRVAVRVVPDSSSRRIASACAMCSTCRRSSRRSADGTARDPGRRPWIRPWRRRSPRRCSSATSPTIIYDGDAPLAERRAQALSIDQAQLRELLGEIELRELLDADAIADVEAELQQLHATTHRATDRRRRARHAAAPWRSDVDEIDARSRRSTRRRARRRLTRARRAIAVTIGRRARASSRSSTRAAIATPSACRCRRDCPNRCSSRRRMRRWTSRGATRARTGRSRPRIRRPLRARTIDRRSAAEGARARRADCSKVISGPAARDASGATRTCCRSIRRRSLAKLRHQVEPVEPAGPRPPDHALAGRRPPRAGLDALLDAIESLQGAPLIASILETEILAGARRAAISPSDLDALTAAGEVVWGGLEPLGEHDGRLALYLTDHVAQAATAPALSGASPNGSARSSSTSSSRARRSSRRCTRPPAAATRVRPSTPSGRSSGRAPSRTTASMRCAPSRGQPTRATPQAEATGSAPDIQKPAPGAAVRRRPLVADDRARRRDGLATEWATALAQQLLARYGVLTREVAAAEASPAASAPSTTS